MEVDLDLNAYGNARLHFDTRKQRAVKQQKTLEANEKALKAAEKKAAHQLTQVKVFFHLCPPISQQSRASKHARIPKRCEQTPGMRAVSKDGGTFQGCEKSERMRAMCQKMQANLLDARNVKDTRIFKRMQADSRGLPQAKSNVASNLKDAGNLSGCKHRS